MTKSRFSGANNWHLAYVAELQGKVQEEELDSGAQPASGGREWKRDEGPGETEGVSPGAILARKNERRCDTAPRWVDN